MAAITQGNLQKIAYALWGAKPEVVSRQHPERLEAMLAQWEHDVKVITEVLAASNPRFDRDIFARAVNATHYTPSLHGR